MKADRKLRIGMVTPALYWGGAERVLVNLGRELREQVEWTGCALCSNSFRTENMVKEMRQSMPVYPCDPSAPPSVYGRASVRKVSRNADAVILWGEVEPAKVLQDFHGRKVFITHGCGDWDKRALEKSAGCTHYVCVSSACKALFSDRPVTIIENGVEPERCTTTRSREDVRKELGLKPDDFAVGYLGRMAPEKTPQKIAMALFVLPDSFKGVWIGGGWQQDVIRNTILRTLEKRAIIRDTVWDIGNYLQAFDLFALVSPAEGFSMAFLEAALVGVPCLMTPVGVMPDLVARHGDLWATIPIKHTAMDLANMIRGVRENLSFWKGKAEKAREVVAGNYLASHMAARWLTYLKGICNA